MLQIGTLENMGVLGAIEANCARKFDISSKKVMKPLVNCECFKLSNPKPIGDGFKMSINLTILARKLLDSL